MISDAWRFSQWFQLWNRGTEPPSPLGPEYWTANLLASERAGVNSENNKGKRSSPSTRVGDAAIAAKKECSRTASAARPLRAYFIS
jgi:hypothetical protein